MSKYPMECAICKKLNIENPETILNEEDYFTHVYLTHPEHSKAMGEGKTFEQVEAEKNKE